MPEKTEDSFESHNGNQEAVLGPNHKTVSKCNKILKMFRGIRKENAKNQGKDSGRKEKKGKCWDLEDRKELLKKNMENSWTELPNTLQRKREKISEEILSEFHDSDSNDSENSKTQFSPFPPFRKKSKEKSYDFKDDGENVNREFFRQKREDELDAGSLVDPGEKAVVGSPRPQTFINRKKKILESTCQEAGEVSLEKIRKLGEDEKLGSETRDGKGDEYNPQTAVDEINLLFHDLIAQNGGQVTDSGTDSDFGNSDTYVNVVFEEKPIENPEEDKVEPEMGKIGTIRRCDSSDSLLNGSSASVSSELSQQETSPEKVCKERTSDFHSENEGNSFEQNAEVTYVNETNDARPKWKVGKKTCCEETIKLLAKIGGVENNKEGNGKETTQYSDIIFSLPANPRGFFVNEEFKGDFNIESLTESKTKDLKPPDRGIIYQELDFNKSFKDKPKTEKESEKFSVGDERKEGKNVFKGVQVQNAVQTTSSSLSEEQKAKKKSAEAIAKELSSQIFSKRNQNAEALENPSGNATPVTVTVAEEGKETVKRTNGEGDSVESGEEAPESPGKAGQEVSESEASKSGGEKHFGVDLQYFSVADWRKAVAMGSKRGIASIAMETIVEEPETDTSTKLTVREILRRFEELGNKHFNDKLCMTDDERTATLKQIHLTLKCLEEKVKNFEIWNESQHQQYLDNTRTADHSSGSWTGRGPSQRIPHSAPPRGHQESEEVAQTSVNDGKHSLLQFAIHHFRQSPEKFEMLKTSDGSISGSLKVIESKNKKNKEKSKGAGKDSSEWTWKEQVDLVKFTAKPIEQSLLQLDTPELSDLAVECFVCLMRYMGDLPMPTDVSEVKCVYTILMHCHKFEQLRDEIYCQLMKQTTNNKSIQQESCQRGWRLFSIVAAYFVSSDTLKPFLFKYLETAAYDKRRAYHGTAMVCLQNLRKTFKYGGRKNVPSVEEITAISAGRNSKRQIYRLPGGTEKVVNTKSTTVVQDVIEELCVMINVTNPQEMEEFSVYCIVEGDTFTMPLAREEYILDVTTELHKNHQVFYLIFCRSVWYFPLRLDSQLYVEVVFNQIAPDYLEGLLLIMPGESLEQEVIYDISKIAALLHRAADMSQVPSMKETKFLLPKPALSVRDVKPSQWVNMVQSNWQDCENLTAIQAKAQVLDVLSKWPLFGSSFFAVKKASEPKERTDHILALNRNGVQFIDLITHETLLHYPFSEVISTRKVKSEDGTLFLDMKCGNLMQQRITRLQTDQAHEISRLIRQYITMQQRMGTNQM